MPSRPWRLPLAPCPSARSCCAKTISHAFRLRCWCPRAARAHHPGGTGTPAPLRCRASGVLARPMARYRAHRSVQLQLGCAARPTLCTRAPHVRALLGSLTGRRDGAGAAARGARVRPRGALRVRLGRVLHRAGLVSHGHQRALQCRRRWRRQRRALAAAGVARASVRRTCGAALE